MPNWCEVDLKVSGPKEDVKDFMKRAKSKDSLLDDNNFIPYPKRFSDMDDATPNSGYRNGGYWWCVENWGSRSGAQDVVSFYNGKSTVNYFYRCAWGPNIGTIKKASEIFPSLRLTAKYYECGQAFCGTFSTKAGKILKDETKDYNGRRGG